MTEQNKSFLEQLKEAVDNNPNPIASAQAQMQLIGKWIAISPVEFFNELREKSPILKAPAFTLVTSYEDIQDVLTLNEIFTTDLLKQNMLKFIGNTVVELPPSPEYEQRKSILRLAFPMADISRYHQILLEEAATLLQNVKEDTPFDLVDYAKKLPATAISRYLGLQGLPIDKLVQWLHDINEGAVRNLSNSPELNAHATAASDELKPKIREILKATRAKLPGGNPVPKPSFWEHLFGLVKTQPEMHPPSNPNVLERYLLMQSVPTTYTTDEDIVSSLLFMMSACVDLTSIAITNVIVELMKRPEIFQEAIAASQQDRDDAIAGYVWESLRFRQPSPGVINTCLQDYTLGKGTDYEQTIKAGTQVLACSIAAMHDPSVIDAPQEFKVGRPAHLAYTFFEAGLHTCHGKYFSMVQIPLAVKQVLRLGTLENVDPLPIVQGYPNKPFHLKVTRS
ncbi:cytochrome P450 [Nostoc sp.]|uniref:cytochrome P450 n=1 Tax=Nostoc sp. TaxID=1180 RepID=UPI002FFD2AF4